MSKFEYHTKLLHPSSNLGVNFTERKREALSDFENKFIGEKIVSLLRVY